MLSTLALSLALNLAAPQPTRAFHQQVDARLKAVFAQASATLTNPAMPKPVQRQGRAPARPLGR